MEYFEDGLRSFVPRLDQTRDRDLIYSGRSYRTPLTDLAESQEVNHPGFPRLCYRLDQFTV
jgi:hypothetical protein